MIVLLLICHVVVDKIPRDVDYSLNTAVNVVYHQINSLPPEGIAALDEDKRKLRGYDSPQKTFEQPRF